MDRTGFLTRHRIALAALGISAAVHAAVFVGMPKRIAGIDQGKVPVYSASLEAAPARPPTIAAPVLAPVPKPRIAPRARAKPLLPVPAIEGPAFAQAQAPVSAAEPVAEVSPQPSAPEPEVVALAQPTTPPPPARPDPFPVQAIPANVSIAYQLTSAFADGRALYTWQRDGDRYRITGEAEAEGFFALFLEGQITQESQGTVTDTGLRPESFVERKPNSAREGLVFDWPGRKVTFSRRGETLTSELADNTVDWLSMIFQMAHTPPRGETMAIQVFTQRKMYRYRLEIVGEETIDIPLGRVRALHLRHDEPNDDREAVDVWLGIDHHYLPVKLRFPVARKRVIVEQVATKVSAR